MTEKQLENLRKGREARAAKSAAKKGKENTPPPAEVAPVEAEADALGEEPPQPDSPPPKPKRKLTQKQLDALRKARESKASRAPPKKKPPPAMVVKRETVTAFEDLQVY